VSDFKSYYLPWAAWVAVLVFFAFVALPEAPQPRALNIDKVRHAAAYALLGAFVVSFFTVLLVGSGTEIIQGFVPGRSADIVDLGADLAGGIFGSSAYLWAFVGRTAETDNEV
jgi:VanZ family protein